MPTDDTPGGPIDPELPIAAIKNGATWKDGALVVDGKAQFLHVEAGAWQLTGRDVVRIDKDTVEKLRTCERSGRFIVIARLPYQLDPVADGEGVRWAVLQPA